MVSQWVFADLKVNKKTVLLPLTQVLLLRQCQDGLTKKFKAEFPR
jgi:hypothetical protein